MTDVNTIGARVAWLRAQRGLSQNGLARLVGIKQPTLWAIENNVTKDPNAATLMSLAAALNANPEWIHSGVGDPFTVSSRNGSIAEEINQIVGSLAESEQASVLAMLRMLKGRKPPT